MFLENSNFTEVLEVGKIYEVQERYHAKEVKIKINKIKENKSKKELSIKYSFLNKNKNFDYTSGQSLVFYKKEKLIGGGIMI